MGNSLVPKQQKQAAWASKKRVCMQEGYTAKENARHTSRVSEKAFKMTTVVTANFTI